MPRKMICNKIKCKLCGDIIESKHTHDFVTCSCGACSADGGKEYIRRCYITEGCYEDLSESIWIDDNIKSEENRWRI